MSASNFKIFGIGLSKTGTTSLAHALEILGYKTKDYPGIEVYRANDPASIDLSLINIYDALTDTPIPSYYHELDALFPGSKFILTVRERGGWLKSCQKQFNERSAEKQNEAHRQLFMDLYGCTVFDEHKFINGYEKFVAEVMDYFKNRPRDLLVINVTAGEGWEKLCPFLECPLPDIPFPKANVTQITWLKIDDVLAIADAAGKVLLSVHCQIHSKSLLTRMWLAIRGGKQAALRRATRASRRIVEDGLQKLNAKIPIVSRGGEMRPHVDRAKWNHFWLVDSLDGEDAFLGDVGEFTIDITLIQDGQPFLGVIHVPLSEMTYYARARKGVFVSKGDAEPEKLEITVRDSSPSQAATGSVALRVCRAATSQLGDWSYEKASHESQIAAATLISCELGRKISVCQTGRPLSFNSQHMEIACLHLHKSN